MLGAQNFADLTYILGLDNEKEEQTSIVGIEERALEIYKQRVCFFKPFEGPTDFFGELLSIIRYPLAFGIGAVMTAFCTVASACYLVGALVCTLGSVIIMHNEYRDASLEAAGNALVDTGVFLLGTVACLLLAVLSLPHNTASALSRVVGTIVPPLEDCCVGEETFGL